MIEMRLVTAQLLDNIQNMQHCARNSQINPQCGRTFSFNRYDNDCFCVAIDKECDFAPRAGLDLYNFTTLSCDIGNETAETGGVRQIPMPLGSSLGALVSVAY